MGTQTDRPLGVEWHRRHITSHGFSARYGSTIHYAANTVRHGSDVTPQHFAQPHLLDVTLRGHTSRRYPYPTLHNPAAHDLADDTLRSQHVTTRIDVTLRFITRQSATTLRGPTRRNQTPRCRLNSTMRYGTKPTDSTIHHGAAS